MSSPVTAFIFPAFVRDYQPCNLFDRPPGKTIFLELLQQAAHIVDPGLLHFHPVHQHFLDHELRTQYIAYIYGCSISRVLQGKGIKPCYLSGYSMGIYAALTEGGAISFKDGLSLIKNAFQEISYTTLTGRFGMGGVVGLSESDILALLTSYPGIEICNQNSPFSFVLSGRQHELELLLETARGEGALHAQMLNVTVPYHSHFLKSAALQFAKIVYSMDIHALSTPVISLLSQQQLTCPEDIKTELVDNLYKAFNWYKTHLVLMSMGVCQFIECGPGNSLKKNARFIEGNYRFLSINDSRLTQQTAQNSNLDNVK